MYNLLPPTQPCPSCGHCPTCGRGGYYTRPYPGYPNPWYYNYQGELIQETTTYGNVPSNEQLTELKEKFGTAFGLKNG